MSSFFVDDHFQFAEMNLRYTGNLDNILTMIRRAVRMGYDSIIINTDIGQLMLDSEFVGEPQRKKKKRGSKERNVIPDPVVIDISKVDTSALETNGKRLRIFSRLTATLSDNTEVHLLMHHQKLKNYDLIAVRPGNEQILQTLSRKGDFVDIITYDQTSSTVGWLNKNKIIQQCISEGLTFEITYADALKDSSERRELLMSTKGGHGVIIASGADAMIDIRAPYDVANIAVLFGVRPEDARKFVAGNARRTLLRAESRKTLKGGMLVQTVEDMPKNLTQRLNVIEKIMRITEFRTQLISRKDDEVENVHNKEADK